MRNRKLILLATTIVVGVVAYVCLTILRSPPRQALAVSFIGYTNLPSGERAVSFTVSNQCNITVERSPVVYFESYPFAPKNSFAPANLPTKQVAQKDLAFVPALLPVEVGTKVEFPNLEKDTYHNIFSYSPAKRFDLGRYRPDEKPVPSQIFDVAGLVTLRCDIHEHMRGLLLVLATPHFAMTDETGHFRLTGLPAGHYTLKAWVDSRTTREHPVDLKSGSTLHVDFP